MVKTIHKQTVWLAVDLDSNSRAKLETFGSTMRLISAIVQSPNMLSVYYESEAEPNYGETTSRVIEVLGTGHPLPDLDEDQERAHIATVQDGPFVWHVFEIVTQPVIMIDFSTGEARTRLLKGETE